MNCDGVSNLLSAYLDGELTPGELLRVEEHLRRCHACADEVDSLRQTVALVASLEEVEVPASFHMQLHQRLVALGPPMAAVRRAPVQPAWQRNVRRWGLPAAAAAAALAIGLTTFDAGRLANGLLGESEYKLAISKPNPSQQAEPPFNEVVDKPDSNQQTTNTVTTQPPAPPVTVVDNVLPPVVPPGDTTTDDGPKGVTTNPVDPAPPGKTATQMEYVYKVAVKGALDPKTEALVRSENANAFFGENTVTIQVPVASREEWLTKVSNTYWPGSTLKDESTDIGADIAGASKQLEAARLQVEADQKNPTDESAVAEHKRQFEEAKAFHELLADKTTFATFIVTFTP
jgi:hypothetical protein